MSRSFRTAFCAGLLLLSSASAFAQDPVPPPLFDQPIGPFVVDARGTLARFKQDPLSAAAIGAAPADLPTRGLGLVVGAHLYPIRKRIFALGVGGEILLRARASRSTPPVVEDGPEGPAIATSLTAISPQVSLNFGKRDGWSYLSGGIGWANFTTELEEAPFEDPESLPRAINYGGGARWFVKKHLAFSFDLRFYKVNAQPATVLRPGFASTSVMIFSAGVSVR
jgi:hypothetical protein